MRLKSIFANKSYFFETQKIKDFGRLKILLAKQSQNSYLSFALLSPADGGL